MYNVNSQKHSDEDDHKCMVILDISETEYYQENHQKRNSPNLAAVGNYFVFGYFSVKDSKLLSLQYPFGTNELKH